MKQLTTNYGIGNTFTFTSRYFDFEGYVIFDRETISNVVFALVVVLFIMFVFTANMTVTFMVLLCVVLVDLFLFGLLSFWDITLNSVTVVNIVIAIGLAIEYTAHIAHAYLTVDPPLKHEQTGEPLTDHQKRVYKARGALGMMGTSVFHGAFSTFLAIVALGPAKSYVFKNFFRMWFGIIVFGVANGFILLPVLLSLFGPLNNVTHIEVDEEKENKDGKGEISMEKVGADKDP